MGFQPTGWAHQRDANQTRARGRRRQKGTIITYQVGGSGTGGRAGGRAGQGRAGSPVWRVACGAVGVAARALPSPPLPVQVPYSEHSSFSELRAFCEWFKPSTIIPSVNSDGGGPKALALVRLLRGDGGG